MKPGPTNNWWLPVAFLACGLLSYFLVSRLQENDSKPADTAVSARVLAHDKGRSAAPARSGARPRPIPPPKWDGTNTVPDINIPELSQFDLVALESHDDRSRAPMFNQLRSAVVGTMTPVIFAARSKCPGKIVGSSTIRLRLMIEANANMGAEITRVDEIISFAGAPVPDGMLTCIFEILKNHPFPVPVTSVPKGNLVAFKGEVFMNARL